ncbi:hypothetical protein HN51_040445 [Arachis hypogaea]|uniref:C2H2-type domain-containing protein n=1 Tax=Arachis hypogaea TaxID=3818 RepID=A0A444YNY1_ARAHY|nr:zinc finger protein ZAT5-like [Arachis ipaensis]XP_025657648.1 zinc finger protein ZAT5-like [Arachis hypogaea]QHN86173.1 Zinc finger protein [Arachis hypogaea]RYR03617.1 hypothetical protein Ahy_B06g082688 [Arachis hypogaea]
MEQQVEEEHVVRSNKNNNNDHMQIMMKGKRTKRQRLPSPLRLAMAMPSSTSSTSSFGLDTPTTTARTEDEDNNDEDMANCLILLAQGGGGRGTRHNNKKESIFNLYDCKTCNRSFPSFQALGGHRASHKKPKILTNSSSVITTQENYNNDPTSTALTLQISNSSLYCRSITTTKTTTVMETTAPISKASKVHECSICGAEFTSGQALGGHMRRHRGLLTVSSATAATTTTTTTTTSSSISGANADHQETKNNNNNVNKNILKLDLNLPAPEDDHHNRVPKFSFQSKEKVIVFSSAASLVDCHY